ncbi:S-layer homology domain-containing protein [Paenibacillus qinlingensis]|uniref:S-layer homology domain-containing protein n=1 Tax=Paenibacillus qinlingensis TaxID=1837343 RepID=UPI001564AC6D|nr:S-layer homology domain-containing protein [Paenibacillus qinlingensis]NQX63605.1 S-layer homology domain-containing protein [Paenibacillus qinlingensis]
MLKRQALTGRVLAIMFLCTVWILPLSTAHADSSPQFKLITTSDSTVVGSDLKVSIQGLQLNDLYAYEINLTFDSTKLQFKTAVSDALGGFTVPPILNGNQLQIAHTSVGANRGLDGSNNLFTLTFTGLATGTADIVLDNIILVDSQLNSLDTAGGAQKSVSIVSNSNGNGGGSGNTGGNPITDSVKITDDGHGKKTVEFPETDNVVRVAVNRIGMDSLKSLEFKKENLSVELPPEVLQQLRGNLSEDQLNKSTLVFTMNPLSRNEADTLIDRGEQSHNVGLKPSGNAYEFSLQLITSDNQITSLTTFTKPITLRFKVDPSLNSKLVSIYFIADDGELEFIGGKYANGEISADIYHFSKYAALEYTKTFEDVPNVHWANNVITELAAKHILSGTSNSQFEPERKVTRAEFTALLVRALHLTNKGNIAFSDVSASDWFYPEVSIAVKAGIVEGKSASAFAPEASITREEMVTMLMRAYGMQHSDAAIPSGTAFDDENAVSPWAVTYVRNARALHLIEGREANLFIPQGVGTRAEASQVIYNFLGL